MPLNGASALRSSTLAFAGTLRTDFRRSPVFEMIPAFVKTPPFQFKFLLRPWVSPTELFDASASMRLESVKSLRPSMRPSCTHCQAMRSKKILKARNPQRALALLNTLWFGISSSRSYPRNQSQSRRSGMGMSCPGRFLLKALNSRTSGSP